MVAPTRFPSGVTNLPSYHPLGNMPVPFNMYCHNYQNDFDAYAAGDWTVGVVGTGTSALVAGNGGILALATSGANNDSVHILKNPLAFAITAGYRACFMARVKVDSVAANNTWQIGLQGGGTAFAPTDGIYFTKAAASTSLVGNIRKASTSTTVAIPNAVIATDTYLTLGFVYDGRNTGPNGASVFFFVGNSVSTDGMPFNSISSYYNGTASITDMTNLPTANLGIGLGVQTNSAAIRTMSIDYVAACVDMVR